MPVIPCNMIKYMVWVSVLRYITIYTLLAYCARRRAFLLFLSLCEFQKTKKTSSFLLSVQFTQNNPRLEILSPLLFPLGPDSSTPKTTSSHWSTILIRKATSFPSIWTSLLSLPIRTHQLHSLTSLNPEPLHFNRPLSFSSSISL